MTSTPFVSIILPIRNEAKYIERCLNAVLTQDYPKDRIEILVVDGMSTDGTREILSKYTVPNQALTRAENSHIIVLDNPDQIVPVALNQAIRRARGEIIVRVDGHTVIAQDYVRQCTKVLRQTQAENTGGTMKAIGENYIGEIVAIATSTPFGVGGSRFHYSTAEEWVDSVYMGAWSRKVFQKFGLFDEELVRNQDDEFNYRLRKREGKILLSPNIQSIYYCRSSLHSVWRQYFQYGFWKVRVLQKHPKQMRLRQLIPPLFVAALMSSLFLSVLTRPGKILFALIGGTYLLANLAASILTAARRGWQSLLLLPLVYAILHTAYGLGFLIGLVKFANRWGDKTGRVPDFRPADA